MPIPFIIGGLAAVAGLAGVGGAIDGKEKMDKAKRIMSAAKSLYDDSVEKVENSEVFTEGALEEVGATEKKFFSGVELFKSTFEKIQQRPEFEGYKNEDVTLPKFTPEKLQEVSLTAEKILGALKGGGAGALSGMAASGATTALVSTFATASTGTAISGLSGAAATNATLAWLGGGAISAGGGGMALGTAILGGASLGIGLLAGGLIFDAKADDALKKARKASDAADEVEEKAKKICEYLDEVCWIAEDFNSSLCALYSEFDERLNKLNTIVNVQGRVRWGQFYPHEKIMTQNLVWLVGLLYKMCNVKLILKKGDEGFSSILNTSYEDYAANCSGIRDAIEEAYGLELVSEDNVSSAVLRQHGL